MSLKWCLPSLNPLPINVLWGSTYGCIDCSSSISFPMFQFNPRLHWQHSSIKGNACLKLFTILTINQSTSITQNHLWNQRTSIIQNPFLSLAMKSKHKYPSKPFLLPHDGTNIISQIKYMPFPSHTNIWATIQHIHYVSNSSFIMLQLVLSITITCKWHCTIEMILSTSPSSHT